MTRCVLSIGHSAQRGQLHTAGSCSRGRGQRRPWSRRQRRPRAVAEPCWAAGKGRGEAPGAAETPGLAGPWVLPCREEGPARGERPVLFGSDILGVRAAGGSPATQSPTVNTPSELALSTRAALETRRRVRPAPALGGARLAGGTESQRTAGLCDQGPEGDGGL